MSPVNAEEAMTAGKALAHLAGAPLVTAMSASTSRIAATAHGA
jgi:hypothetical protein